MHVLPDFLLSTFKVTLYLRTLQTLKWFYYETSVSHKCNVKFDLKVAVGDFQFSLFFQA